MSRLRSGLFCLLLPLAFCGCDQGLNDFNFRSYADEEGITISGETITPPANTDDTLKLSHASEVLVENCVIYGGSEDCIDINRVCTAVVIRDCELYPQGLQAITIKGGSTDILLENVVIHPGATDCDIELGMYAHTGHEVTGNIRLVNVTKSDGSAVRVNVWDAELPAIENTKARVTVYSPVIWGIYFFGRDTGLW